MPPELPEDSRELADFQHGVLDRAKFTPVVTRAWAGILEHIYSDGRLGSIQPIDGQPGKFKPSSKDFDSDSVGRLLLS